MNKEQKLKGNTRLAKFMGATVLAEYNGEAGGYFNSVIYDYGMKCTNSPNGNRYISDLNMQYDSDWNWIMPVIEKIETLGFEFTICGNEVYFQVNEIVNRPSFNEDYIIVVDNNRKLAIFECACKFLDWYEEKLK